MTTTAQPTRAGSRPRTDVPASRLPARTLADEHALLLQQVAVRADDLLTAAAEGRWPAEELRALLGYLRAEVLRQVSDEERLLFPVYDTSPDRARLARDHVRLRQGIDLLARTAAGEHTRSLTRLTVTIRDLLAQLERHLADEDALLAAVNATDQVPATMALTGRSDERYPLTAGPTVDLDALPDGQRVHAVVDRLLRLPRGEQVELRSGSDPLPVWRQIDRLVPGGYGFDYLRDGPDRWSVRVTRRPAA